MLIYFLINVVILKFVLVNLLFFVINFFLIKVVLVFLKFDGLNNLKFMRGNLLLFKIVNFL